MILLSKPVGDKFVLQVTEREAGKIHSKLVDLIPGFKSVAEVEAYAKAKYPQCAVRFVVPRRKPAGRVKV